MFRSVCCLLFLLVSFPVFAGIEPPVLRVSLETEPMTFDWHDSRSTVDRYLVSFLMRGLLKYDAKNQPVCDLCKTFGLSEDGKVLRFELGTSEEWSDGVKLEAQHFVDSFRRLLDPANHFRAAGNFTWIQGAKQPGGAWDARKLCVRTEGKSVVVFELTRPVMIFPHLLTTIPSFPIRKEFFKGPHDTGENHASTAVLGPYQLAAWEHGKRVVIEGNPKFTGTRPVYRVDFVLGTHAQLLAKFKAGKLDILANPTGDDLMKAPGQKIQVNPYWATRGLLLNVGHPVMASQAMRHALVDTIDRDSLPPFLRNGERRVTGLVPPGLMGYRELPLATPDLTRAATERAQAVPGGKPVMLSLLAHDLESERRVADWLGAQLEKIQIKLVPRFRSGGAYYADLESGHFDLALMTWSFDIASPMDMLRSFETMSMSNRGHWTNVGFDALLGQLLREPSPKGAVELVDQITQIAEIKDPAVIPLGYPTQPFMLGSRVTSFAITPFGDPDLVKIELKH